MCELFSSALCILFALARIRFSPYSPFGISIFIIVTFSAQCKAQYMVEVLEKSFAGYRVVLRCEATGADFGAEIAPFSYVTNFTGCALFTVPDDACENPVTPATNLTTCSNIYAVVPRGNCSFSEKAYYVQGGRPISFRALIVYNEPDRQPVPMAGGKFAEKVTIPIVMISYSCMEVMMGRYSAESGFVVAIRAIPGYYDLIKYLIPFVGVVGICFVVLFISLIIRVCRERRRIARKRLSRSNLKKLPTKKYKKGDEPETCAVCLEDFVEGEKLRILPCNHAYHCKCIDPWLTKNRKVCPICKRKVLSTGDSDSSDSDVERRANAAAGTSTTTRENAPLLSNEQPMASSVVHQFAHPSGVHLVAQPSDVHPIAHPGDGDHYAVDREAAGILSSAVRVITTWAQVHDSSEGNRAGNPYEENVIRQREDESFQRGTAGSIKMSEKLRNKLRPLVQTIVSRASRNPKRDQEPLTDASQVVANEDGERNFAAENDAFEESAEHESRDCLVQLSENADVPSSSAAPPMVELERRSKRRRHPAASGRLTEAELDLESELPDNHLTGRSASYDSKEIPQTVDEKHWKPLQNRYQKEKGMMRSSRSMPRDLPVGSFKKKADYDEPYSEVLESDEGKHVPADRQRSCDDDVFEASIDLGSGERQV